MFAYYLQPRVDFLLSPAPLCFQAQRKGVRQITFMICRILFDFVTFNAYDYTRQSSFSFPFPKICSKVRTCLVNESTVWLYAFRLSSCHLWDGSSVQWIKFMDGDCTGWEIGSRFQSAILSGFTPLLLVLSFPAWVHWKFGHYSIFFCVQMKIPPRYKNSLTFLGHDYYTKLHRTCSCSILLLHLHSYFENCLLSTYLHIFKVHFDKVNILVDNSLIKFSLLFRFWLMYMLTPIY